MPKSTKEKVSSAGRKKSQMAGNAAKRGDGGAGGSLETPDLSEVFVTATADGSGFRAVTPHPVSASLRDVRELIWRALPLDAQILVVTDDNFTLLAPFGAGASHFPQSLNGHRGDRIYPPDGIAIIAQLEALRAKGAQYLVLPSLARGWFEWHQRFVAHVQLNYPLVIDDPERCEIYALERRRARETSTWRARVLDLIERCSAETGTEPAILDWNTGLGLKSLLPTNAVFSPPTDQAVPPYLDRSVDIVVLLSPGEEAARESRRFARHAVVTLEPENEGDDPLASTKGIDRLRIEIEHVDGGRRVQDSSTSIIVPTHHGWERLRPCLRSLEETLPDPFDGEVIVVDDGADGEGTPIPDELTGLASRLNLKVVAGLERGFCESCNRGAAEAQGDLLVFLGEDVIVQVGWLGALRAILRDNEVAGAVTGKVLDADSKVLEAGSIVYSDGSMDRVGSPESFPDDARYSFVREVDVCSPALLATPRTVFEEVGGFEGPPGYEHADYCFTLRDRGQKAYYQPEALGIQGNSADEGKRSKGAAKFQMANQAKFVQKWDAMLRGQPAAPRLGEGQDDEYLDTHLSVGRVLVCAPLLPEFDREGGSRRVYSLIEFLRELGWAVTFVSESAGGDDRYVRILQQKGVAVYRGLGPQTDRLFEEGAFDVAFFAFWHLAEEHLDKLREFSPDTKIFVDIIDLHLLRNARKFFRNIASGETTTFIQESGARYKGESNADFTSEMIRELRTYASVDAVFAPSEKEADMINDLLGDWSCAHTLRSHEESIVSPVPLQERRGILFVANFNHPPNIDALTFFVEDILPKIDPELLKLHPLSIVGQNPPPTLLQIAKSSPYVEVFGWVPSVIPYLQQARVTVVPMRYGAGTKTKLLQALMAQTPTVTSTVGLEGFSVVPGRHVLVADNAADFAAETERLLRDPELWVSLRDKGGEEISSLHSRETVRGQLREVLESTVFRSAVV
jgi:GT2 family glycosyltransferase/glycosyltransferase involved in cell wall biosynthesis